MNNENAGLVRKIGFNLLDINFPNNERKINNRDNLEVVMPGKKENATNPMDDAKPEK